MYRPRRRHHVKWLVASMLLLAMSACSLAPTPGSSATEEPTSSTSLPPATFGTPHPTTAYGAETLVADLVAGGVMAKVGATFLAEPLPAEGILVCLGAEAVQMYVLKDHEAALAAASVIDREDPSKIGTTIVDWAGRPRFWLHDRVLVLYVGDNAPTDAALRSLLGEPFAEGHVAGRPPLPSPDCA